MTEETINGEEIHRKVTISTLPYSMDYQRQTETLNNLTALLRGSDNPNVHDDKGIEPIYTCDDRLPLSNTAMLNFFPVYNDYINDSNSHVTFEGRCFDFDVTY